MQVVKVERADHHGIIAGVIHDLGIIDFVNDRLGIDSDEKVTAGEALAAMIINGLGFTDRPLTLAPQFFANCPLDLLFNKAITANELNRFKLGRTLDRIHGYGCDLLFSELALKACKQEGIDTRFGHLDTSSFSLTGQYLPDSEENAVLVTHGHSKDHRPDLKQVVQELMVSSDGGVPMLSKVWDGNTSDSEIFRKRSEALVASFKSGDGPQVIVADSKLYSKKNMENLANLPFVTRIPDNNALVLEKIRQSIIDNNWMIYDEKRRYRIFEVEHYDVKQRWIVVQSQEAENRSEQTIKRQTEKEKELISKELFHLQAQRFACPDDAKRDLDKKAKKWKYHLLGKIELIEHRRFNSKGRPSNTAITERIEYQILAETQLNEAIIKEIIQERSCFIIASNTDNIISDKDIIEIYTKQNGTVERGFRFLKDPLFFVSSLFLKKPSRIEGLLIVMTLALLVYAIAERRLRKMLNDAKETIPNQINQPTQIPTLRWVFQLLDGINRVTVCIGEEIHQIWQGITELRRKILLLFGKKVMNIYQISSS
jgi:transposase